MPRLFIPSRVRPLAGGAEEVDVQATSVRQAIAELDERFPGIRDRLCKGDELKPGLTVAVDGNISSLGLLQKLDPESEVHFLPAVGGG
jgi:molybdopterin synthase sulfur carrier subunit